MGKYTHWIIFAAGITILLVVNGVQQSYSIFINPISLDLGWNRTAVSLPYSLLILFWGLSQPIGGRLLDIYGPRIIILISLIVGSLALFITALVSQVWQMSIIYGVILGITIAGSSRISFIMLLVPWFDERQRAKVFAVITATTPASAFVFAPVAFAAISNWGWRGGFTVLGLFFLACIPLVLFILRERKVDDGAAETLATPDNAQGNFLVQMFRDGYHAFRYRPFLYLFLAYFACGFTGFFFFGHIAAVATDNGFSPAVGAAVATISGIAATIGTIFWGALADRYYKSRTIVLFGTYFTRALGFILLVSLTTNNPYVFYAMAFIAVFPMFGSAVITNVMVYEIFPGQKVGMLMGLMFTLHQVGGFLGALVGGIFYDLGGGYALMFWLGAGFLLFSSVMSLLAGKVMRAETKKQELLESGVLS